MRHTVDPVELAFIALCHKHGYKVENPPDNRIDFYLPDFGLYVEVKQYPTPRLHAQLESIDAGPANPALVLVGESAVNALDRMIDAVNAVAVKRPRAEQAETQLAGCSTAALGGTNPATVATPGMYGWSQSYQDVLNLRRRHDRLEQALQKISSQGYWAHDTTSTVLVKLLDEYKDLADAALARST